MVFATWRQCAPHLTHASLGPPESKSQTAPRSVQPFLGDRCKTLRPILSDRCLSVCQSVTLVYCGQTAGWIKMPLGVEVGLGPGHIVLDENPAPRKGAQQPPVFGPCLLWPNVDQDATRRHYLTWGPSSPRKGAQQPPLFGPCLLRPTGWMYQDSSWYGDRRRPRLHCVRWGRSSPHGKGHSSPPPLFGAFLLWPNGRPYTAELLLHSSQQRVAIFYNGNGPPLSPQNCPFL